MQDDQSGLLKFSGWGRGKLYHDTTSDKSSSDTKQALDKSKNLLNLIILGYFHSILILPFLTEACFEKLFI